MSPTDRRPQPADDDRTSTFGAASGAGVPPLTVWLGSAMYTFPADRDVVVGRDRECDIRFHDINPEDLTLISRVHAILRFDGGHWLVVDKSQNGIYANGSRSNVIPIRDRLSVALGSPRGPQLSFRVATPAAPAPGDPAATERFRPPPPPPAPPVPPTRGHSRPPPRPPGPPSQPSRPAPIRSHGTATIGRAKSNSIVVEDALASRVHAVLDSTPAGLEIRDNHSSNGIFVNGTLVASARCVTATSSRSATPTCSRPATPWSPSALRPATAG